MISGRRTEQHVIIAGFLPHHWLYEWFSQFHSGGTYSVLLQSPSIVLCMNRKLKQDSVLTVDRVTMPTVLLLDVSLSMSRTVPGTALSSPVAERNTYRHLAVCGINSMLDYLASNNKLEFVSLVFIGFLLCSCGMPTCLCVLYTLFLRSFSIQRFSRRPMWPSLAYDDCALSVAKQEVSEH